MMITTWFASILMRKSSIIDFQLPDIGGTSPLDSSLYGSNTRDGSGAFIIAGAYGDATMKPVLLRIGWNAPVSASAGQ